MHKGTSGDVLGSQVRRRKFLKDSLITVATWLLPTVSSPQSGAPNEIADAGQAHADSRLRPFYLIGHDTNTIELVNRCLLSGANALEIDINVLSGDRSQLCVCHGPELTSGPASNSSIPLSEFLTALNCEAQRFERLCLIYFDCKPLAATERHFKTMLDLIRSKLMAPSLGDVGLSVIISVPSLKQRAMFGDAKALLAASEAVMIDQEKDFDGVVDLFSKKIGIRPYCFANGVSLANNLALELFPSIEHSLQKARAYRAGSADPRLIFTWTVNSRHLMKRWVKFGVDGIISDCSPHWYNPGTGLTDLVDLVENHGNELGVRAATRHDDPFGDAL